MGIIRTAIYQRIPICTKVCTYDSCRLCNSSTDCYGTEYDETQEYECLHITKHYDTKKIVSEIWAAHERSSLLRLVVDSEVPDEILWAASYHELNICQINLNMLSYREDIKWVQHFVSVADKCGMYVVLYLYPIIPTVVRASNVIEVIDNFRVSGYFHTNLGFCKLHNCVDSDTVIGYNGIPISKDYIFLNDEGLYVCTESFKKRFTEIVGMYTVPRKLSMSGCEDPSVKNCHGIKRRKKVE